MKKAVKIVKKPWGRELWFAESKHYLGKILVLFKGKRLSRQYHKYKHETLMCVKGRCVVELEGKKVVLTPNHSIELAPRTIHRICAPVNRVELCEVSTSHPDDVVRLEDDYGRKGKNTK